MNEKTLKHFHAQFQTFDDPQDASESEPRLVALRAELARRGLDAFIVPHADRYQNEYLPPSEERLAWLTGFTGSAGTAVVLKERAALSVDGRYTLQAREQVDSKLFEIVHLTETPIEQWLESVLGRDEKLGYDPWLHTIEGAHKLERIRDEVAKLRADALVVADPQAVCWAFNIRGSDVAHTPLALASAIV